eukprot:882835-Alexandrium_andersonii.AAC.1
MPRRGAGLSLRAPAPRRVLRLRPRLRRRSSGAWRGGWTGLRPSPRMLAAACSASSPRCSRTSRTRAFPSPRRVSAGASTCRRGATMTACFSTPSGTGRT